MSLFGALVGLLLLAAFCFNPAMRRTPGIGYLLSLLLLVIFSQFSRLAYDSPLSEENVKWWLLRDLLFFTIGQLLFLYLRRRLTPDQDLRRDAWHILPGTLHALILLLDVTLLDNQTILAVLTGERGVEITYLSLLVAVCFNGWYAYRIYRLIKAYGQAVDQRISFASESMRFFQLFIAIYLLDLMAGLGLLIWGWTQGLYAMGIFSFGIFWMLLAGWVFVLAFYALTKPEVFQVSLQGKPTKYPHSTLTDKDLRLLKTRVDLLMASKKLHLNQRLRKSDLVDELEISSSDLSRVLNEGFGMNFFEYVNVHRVQEFIALVEAGSHQHLSLLGIAEQAGFNSKATFYKAFKEIVGQTPREYFKKG